MNEYIKQANDFLKKHNTKLEVKFKRFGSMPWDEDGQQRNVFDVTLSNQNGSFTFEFGNSVVDSCAIVSELDSLNDTDKIDFYAGLRLPNSNNISCGVSFSLTKEDALNLDYDFVSKKADQMQEQLNKKYSSNNKKYYDSFDAGKISRDKRDSKLIQPIKDNGVFIQCIQKAVKRKFEELEKSTAYSKNTQKEGIEEPTAYDILSGLNVSYFDSPDEVYQEFGEMKPSQAFAIYEQDQILQKLFNDHQLNDLHEVA